MGIEAATLLIRAMRADLVWVVRSDVKYPTAHGPCVGENEAAHGVETLAIRFVIVHAVAAAGNIGCIAMGSIGE